jgi:hypothetical protein
MASTDVDTPAGARTWLRQWSEHRATAHAGRLYDIAAVSKASGLPCPVIMQLVPRTWTETGWQYTGAQLAAAVAIAADLRRQREDIP